MSQPSAANATDVTPAQRREKRKRLFLILGGVIVVVGILWFLYWLLIGSRHVETDDAYVGADTAQITALVAGPLTEVRVKEMQTVKVGDVLAVIDPADMRLALARAEAELGQAERKVKGYYANDDARRSDIARADAQVAAARSDVARATIELKRRTNLAPAGAVSGDELTEAQSRLVAAEAMLKVQQAGLAQARANAEASQILVAGATVDTNPEVAAARAQVDQARLDLSRTVVRAPMGGIVTKKSIQIGQRVQTGTQMMILVPIETAFVDANFKEVQLRKIRIGAPATVTSDLYGKKVEYRGTVTGLSGGSGAAFALIPPQNATGNWIKVVQRVPVRIRLDPKELAENPLRVGLSMTVSVDAR